MIPATYRMEFELSILSQEADQISGCALPIATYARPVRAGLTVSAALVSLLGVVGCRTAVLLQPPPVSFAPLPVSAVEAAIYQGCSVRQWMPNKLREGLVEATLYQRSHVAVVDISYDDDSFEVRYVRSENLRYTVVDGIPRIHEGYNKWVKNLVGDIEIALNKERALARPARTP